MKNFASVLCNFQKKSGFSRKLTSRGMNSRDATPLTAALGYVSIGLGLTQVLAPRQLSQAIGVGSHTAMMRSLGLREIAAGVGILNSDQPSQWLWARAAGDLMDLALLGTAFRTDNRDGTRLGCTTAMIAAIAALDVYAARLQEREE
jgi:hypothetical protein